MYMVRDLFHTKPGKAKELVKKFKQAAPSFEKHGMKRLRVMTDIAADYWTVVFEYEIEDLGDFGKEIRKATKEPDTAKILEGYIELVTGGKREIFLLE